MSREFTGGPQSSQDRVRSWLAPRGGALTDGARLAAINSVGIIAALIAVTLISLLARALDQFLPIPVLAVSLIALLMLVAGSLFITYRYAAEHGKVARNRNNDVRPDVFGAVSAIPFAAIAIILLLFGLLGMLFAVITIDSDRALDALQRMGFGVMFLVLAGGTIIAARAASDTDERVP